MIKLAIERPVGVLVGVLLVLLFGALSLSGLPIQLTPDVSQPTITVSTIWPGAAPAEVERQILLEQEEVLKSVDGLDRMEGTASTGSSELVLEFDVGTSMDEALVRVANRLNQVPDYPEAARPPVLATADSGGPPMAVLVIRSRDGRPVAPTRTWVAENVVPLYERIPGVASTRHFGGQDAEVQVRFDAAALAARGIGVGELVRAVQGELRDVSGGTIELGKRRFIVRTEVAPDEPSELEAGVLRVEADGSVVRLGDVAEVSIGLRKADRYVLANGEEAMALLFDREAGSNVLEVTEALLDETERIDRELLAPRGLTIEVVSDQRGYINGALELVRNNLLIGGALAIGVLLAFLRSVSASFVVATAIPVCVVGTVLGMSLLGRSVNVVSLAGMAFAVGMVVDNAIVVLENIDTWRRRGVAPAEAALEGTKEVWGAIIASTLTTAAVFLPIIGWQDEVGELLRDVAVSITVAVCLSLLVSVLVIPSFSARLLRSTPAVGMVVDNAIVVLENIDTWRRRGVAPAEAALEGTKEVWGAIIASTLTTAAVFLPIIGWQDEVGELLRDVAVSITVAVCLSLLVSVLVIPSFSARLLRSTPAEADDAAPGLGARLRDGVVARVAGLVRSRFKSVAVVGLAVGGAFTIAVSLLPPMEYLPQGSRNFMFAVVVPPTGYGVEEMHEIGQQVQAAIVPKLEENGGSDPAIGRTFFAALPGTGFMGASGATDDQIGPTVAFVNQTLRGIPGVMGFASQASLFGRSLSSGRGIDLELYGADTPTLVEAGGILMGKLAEVLPDAQVRPTPALDLGGPELRVVPVRQLAEPLGLSAADVGIAVDAFVDGRIVGELGPEGETQLDVVVMAEPGAESPTELLAMPLATPVGEVVPMSTVARSEEVLSPTSITRVERARAITLEVSPSEAMALETAMDLIREEVLPEVVLPDGVDTRLSGAAGKLDETQRRFGQILLLATVISFLLMAALFEDFLAPLVILVTVPLAGAGGVLGLRLVDATLGSQPLDMMTALGFVILIGVVVNNAILIVDGALARLREGVDLDSATAQAVGARVRPIFMSSLTSLAGLLPLVLFPGSGSELYRGVGAIVLGGLALSTVLSLFVVPCLFGLLWRLGRRG